MKEFDAWLKDQVECQGLVTLGVCVVGNASSAHEHASTVAQGVKAEILQAERAIASGNLRSPPGPTSFIPPEILAEMRSVRV